MYVLGFVGVCVLAVAPKHTRLLALVSRVPCPFWSLRYHGFDLGLTVSLLLRGEAL